MPGLRLSLAALLLLTQTTSVRAQSSALPQDIQMTGELTAALRKLWDRISGRRDPPAPPRPQQGPPADDSVIRVVSWNVQRFGTHVNERRAESYRTVLGAMFADEKSGHIIAAQEISSERSSDNFHKMLPGAWTKSFKDSKDSLDNGFFVRPGVSIDCDRRLFSDPRRSMHPARMIHVSSGELDFTLITVHLKFKARDVDATAKELKHIAAWLGRYRATAGHDPDVLIAGDFNLPSRGGKAASSRGTERKWKPIEDLLGDSSLHVLVDDLTSRGAGEPADNYDHFVLTDDLFAEEYVDGSAGVMRSDAIQAAEKANGMPMSDHLPIALGLRTKGPGRDGRPIHLDGNTACGVQ